MRSGDLEIRSSKSSQKLAFVGAFCSGKTTLFNGFQQRLHGDPRFVFVEEAARMFLRNNHFSLTERNSLHVQRKIKEFIIESKQQDAIRQESEEQRQRNHDAYIGLFAQKHFPYQLISGTLPERLQKVDTILQEKLR